MQSQENDNRRLFSVVVNILYIQNHTYTGTACIFKILVMNDDSFQKVMASIETIYQHKH